jgi:hypothetical protein
MFKSFAGIRSWSKNSIMLLAVLLTLGGTALAQDPSGRAGRLNFIVGSVSFRPAGLDDWGPAVVNDTVTTGDRLWTDSGSRAELHVGSTALRVGSQTDLNFLNVSDQTTQVAITQGSLCVHIHHLDSGDVFEVDTPNAALSLSRTGSYRIDVGPDGNQCKVMIHSGEVEVTAEGSAFPVKPNQVGVIYGTDNVNYDITGMPAADEWDQWCASRERREAAIAEQHYVSAEMTGYEDLAGYGSWSTGTDGAYWVPSHLEGDWAPYQYGRWTWVGSYGWTWVDASPWGFAPFHYGRWAFVGGGWGWYPGTFIARPYFAPALVAFVGFGGGIGWFPLGPHEAYFPGYYHSDAYFRSVNITHVNVTNIHVTNFSSVNYVNRRVPGAVGGMSQKDFGSGRAFAGAHDAGGHFASAAVTGMHAPVTPGKQSFFGQHSGRVGAPPKGALGRSFVAKSTPPGAPVPFSKQQADLKAHPGQPLHQQSLAGGSPPSTFKSAAVSSGGGGLHPARTGIASAHSLSGGPSTSGLAKTGGPSTGTGKGATGSGGGSKGGSATGGSGSSSGPKTSTGASAGGPKTGGTGAGTRKSTVGGSSAGRSTTGGPKKGTATGSSGGSSLGTGSKTRTAHTRTGGTGGGGSTGVGGGSTSGGGHSTGTGAHARTATRHSTTGGGTGSSGTGGTHSTGAGARKHASTGGGGAGKGAGAGTGTGKGSSTASTSHARTTTGGATHPTGGGGAAHTGGGGTSHPAGGGATKPPASGHKKS